MTTSQSLVFRVMAGVAVVSADKLVPFVITLKVYGVPFSRPKNSAYVLVFIEFAVTSVEATSLPFLKAFTVYE